MRHDNTVPPADEVQRAYAEWDMTAEPYPDLDDTVNTGNQS
jgi:hypothetical protein